MTRRLDYLQVAKRALARLGEAPAFQQLPPERRRQLAHDTAKVAR